MSDTPPILQPTGSSNELPALQKRAKVWLCLVIVSVVGIIVPLVIGALGTIFGMASAFDKARLGGTPEPEALANDISYSLISTAGGILVALFCGVLFLVSLPFWLVSLSKVKNYRKTPQA